MAKKTVALAIGAVLLVALAGCGGDSDLEVDAPWARASAMMTSAGAVYMDLTSAEGDELVAASVDSSIAGSVELHETAMADESGDEMEDMAGSESEDMAGMGEMVMRQVAGITLPAGETVSLEPGGYHVMLLDLPEPLEVGQTFDLVLSFASAEDITVEVEVRDEAP